MIRTRLSSWSPKKEWLSFWRRLENSRTRHRRQWQDYTRISMRQEGHGNEGRISEGSGLIYSSRTLVHVCYHYYDYLALDWQDESQSKHFNCSILLITTSLVFAFIIKEKERERRQKGSKSLREENTLTESLSSLKREQTNLREKQLKL